LEKRFFKRYPNISSVNAVSSVTRKGIDTLKKEIEDTARKQTFMGESVPNTYFTLEQALQEEKASNPIISLSRLQGMTFITCLY